MNIIKNASIIVELDKKPAIIALLIEFNDFKGFNSLKSILEKLESNVPLSFCLKNAHTYDGEGKAQYRIKISPTNEIITQNNVSKIIESIGIVINWLAGPTVKNCLDEKAKEKLLKDFKESSQSIPPFKSTPPCDPRFVPNCGLEERLRQEKSDGKLVKLFP